MVIIVVVRVNDVVKEICSPSLWVLDSVWREDGTPSGAIVCGNVSMIATAVRGSGRDSGGGSKTEGKIR